MTCFVDYLDQSLIATIVRSALYPYVRALHFFGAALTVGGIVLIDLRILGVGSATPRAALHNFAMRLIWVGFILAIAAGIMLFLAQPAALIGNGALQTKVVLLGFAGVNALAFECLDDSTKAIVSKFGKLCAILSIVLWIMVLLFSSLIPYWAF